MKICLRKAKYLAKTHKAEKVPREEWKFRLIFDTQKCICLMADKSPILGVDFDIMDLLDHWG